MNSDAPVIIYGYQIIVPETDSPAFIHDMISINDTLISPIQICCITPSLSSHDVRVIIGFIPENHLSGNIIHLDALREFIMDNPMFDGIHISEKPAFYAGYLWNDMESEESEESEDSEDSEESEDSESSHSSDESDDKNPHESDDKSISYYVSKYYI